MVSISPNGLVGASLPIADLKSTAFEQCIARVKLVIEQVKLGVLNDGLSRFHCPITTDFPEDPVVTNCGHLFDGIVLKQWKNRPCPLCRDPITLKIPVHKLREFVTRRWPKDPVLTCASFTRSDRELADGCLTLAKSCVKKEKYEEALEFYSKALQYTKASADYAAIPELYEKLKEPGKAALSRMYLSLYQLQEREIQEAIKTLESYSSEHVSSLIIALKLQSCPSPENIEWAMKEASDQKNPEDSIFIYKQILGIAPDHFDAHQNLVLLTEDPEEKRELLCRQEWVTSQIVHLPPYPQELQDFLAGDCTIWPGQKRYQTHIVVPLFPQIPMDGASIPSTLESLDLFDKRSGGPGYRYLSDKIPKNISAEKEFHYAVMTKDVLPESRNRPYDDPIRSGYEVPGVFDAARAILWENRLSEKKCFNDHPWTFTYCKESVPGGRVIVGGCLLSGLAINIAYSPDQSIGVAGWRMF